MKGPFKGWKPLVLRRRETRGNSMTKAGLSLYDGGSVTFRYGLVPEKKRPPRALAWWIAAEQRNLFFPKPERCIHGFH
jgi:hypothetical protein